MNDINQFYSDLCNSVSKAQTAAYTYQGKSVNYPEFMKLAECIHSNFSDCQKTPIITMINKDIKSYAAILAIVLSGNTWVPLSTSSPPHRNAAIIKNFDQKFPSGFWNLFRGHFCQILFTLGAHYFPAQPPNHGFYS